MINSLPSPSVVDEDKKVGKTKATLPFLIQLLTGTLSAASHAFARNS
jgi:hypothetical protein